jgi:Flp pilus assembly protein TadD
LDVANDRQLYLALAGPAWLLAYGLGKAAARWGAGVPATAVAVLCLGLGASTHVRNRVYGDELTFWADVVLKAPNNPRAHNNLGYALALRHRDDEAAGEFRKSLALDPSYFKAAINLNFLEEGVLRERRGAH